MPKNRDSSTIFPKGKVSLLFDTSALVRIKNFEASIHKYNQFFSLFTLDKNKTELSFLYEKEGMMDCMKKLINELQQNTIVSLKVGDYKKMPRKFETRVNTQFPDNGLSYIDKLLIYYSLLSPETVILVTNDRKLREIATEMGVTSFGARELYIISYWLSKEPASIEEIMPEIKQAMEVADADRNNPLSN